MDHLPSRTLSALIILAGLCGCTYLDTGSSRLVTLPDPPPAWRTAFGPMSHLVIWIDESGRPRQCRLGPGEGRLSVRTGKEGWNPVAAFALPPQADAEAAAAARGGADGLFLYPSGAVIAGAAGPAEPLGEEVRLSYREGAAAFILLRLAGQRVPIEAINVPRLLRELSERTGGDPWRTDVERLVLRLAAKDFRADLIRVRDEITVSLPDSAGGEEVPAPRALVSRDPLRPEANFLVDDGGVPGVSAPTASLSRFYSADGAARYDLWISPDGGAQWITAPLPLHPR